MTHSEHALASNNEQVLHGALDHRVQSLVRTQPLVHEPRHATHADGSSVISQSLKQIPETWQCVHPPVHEVDISAEYSTLWRT